MTAILYKTFVFESHLPIRCKAVEQIIIKQGYLEIIVNIKTGKSHTLGQLRDKNI